MMTDIILGYKQTSYTRLWIHHSSVVQHLLNPNYQTHVPVLFNHLTSDSQSFSDINYRYYSKAEHLKMDKIPRISLVLHIK